MSKVQSWVQGAIGVCPWERCHLYGGEEGRSRQREGQTAMQLPLRPQPVLRRAGVAIVVPGWVKGGRLLYPPPQPGTGIPLGKADPCSGGPLTVKDTAVSLWQPICPSLMAWVCQSWRGQSGWVPQSIRVTEQSQAHSYLLSKSMSVCVQSLQSRPTLCDPMDHSPPGSSVHGIFQARIMEWMENSVEIP